MVLCGPSVRPVDDLVEGTIAFVLFLTHSRLFPLFSPLLRLQVHLQPPLPRAAPPRDPTKERGRFRDGRLGAHRRRLGCAEDFTGRARRVPEPHAGVLRGHGDRGDGGRRRGCEGEGGNVHCTVGNIGVCVCVLASSLNFCWIVSTTLGSREDVDATLCVVIHDIV